MWLCAVWNNPIAPDSSPRGSAEIPSNALREPTPRGRRSSAAAEDEVAHDNLARRNGNLLRHHGEGAAVLRLDVGWRFSSEDFRGYGLDRDQRDGNFVSFFFGTNY